ATPIADIAYHSKAVRSGGLFVAIPGLQHDGHAFVSEAIARGAAAVVVQRPTEVPPGVTQVVVADSRIALASLSCAFFAAPSRAAVFTNLTQDHLDFHKTLDAYRAAKRTLFEMVDADGNATINVDDPSASAMAASSRAPVVTYGLTSRADVRAERVRLHLGGSEFMAVT